MSHGAVTRILAIRHGETAWNVDTRIQGQPTSRSTTGPLAGDARRRGAGRRGHHGALQRATWLRPRRPPSRWPGPLGLMPRRARPARTGLRHLRRPDLGRDREPIIPREPANAGASASASLAPRAASSWRVLRALRGLRDGAGAAPRGRIAALVAHGGVLDCLYRAAVRVDSQCAAHRQLGNGSINRLLYTSHGLSAVGWADTVISTV